MLASFLTAMLILFGGLFAVGMIAWLVGKRRPPRRDGRGYYDDDDFNNHGDHDDHGYRP